MQLYATFLVSVFLPRNVSIECCCCCYLLFAGGDGRLKRTFSFEQSRCLLFEGRNLSEDNFVHSLMASVTTTSLFFFFLRSTSTLLRTDLMVQPNSHHSGYLYIYLRFVRSEIGRRCMCDHRPANEATTAIAHAENYHTVVENEH